MRIVAGLSLKNLKPRIWDPGSPEYLVGLSAVMVSWSEIVQMPSIHRAIAAKGLRDYLGLPSDVLAYLDNGSFSLLGRDRSESSEDYVEFVNAAQPDWYPIPRDYIPHPRMTVTEQKAAFAETMRMNTAFRGNGYVPVVHVSNHLGDYISAIQDDPLLDRSARIALGGIVPNLLRSPKALPYNQILDAIERARVAFAEKELHLFGIGGTATLHIAGLLGMDSVDSSGWRSRAARGLVQLPGTGDRSAVKLGNWRGRVPTTDEWRQLEACSCPACSQHGIEGLKQSRIAGFRNRALHNLWVLHEEARLIEEHLAAGTYGGWYRTHLDNSVYRPLIDRLVEARFGLTA